MRGKTIHPGAMFSYVSLEDRIPKSHPLRKLRLLVDAVLSTMDKEFEVVYAQTGRPSVPPERLLKAMLQILFTVRSERLLAERIDDNLLYRWFVGGPGVLRTGSCPGRLAAMDLQRTLQCGRHVDRRLGLA